jgi:hypothetical protein
VEEQNSEAGAPARAGKELLGVGLYHSPLRQIRMKFAITADIGLFLARRTKVIVRLSGSPKINK